MFEYKYKIPKVELKTTFGSICIRNIIFDPYEIEKALPDIVLDDENLMHMFAEDDLSIFKKKNIYKRFAPRTQNAIELEQFVDNGLASNKNFYSFLAEGILGLIFRDIYDYQLAKGVIDVNDTLNDTHTGVDEIVSHLNVRYSTTDVIKAINYLSVHSSKNKSFYRDIKRKYFI